MNPSRAMLLIMLVASGLGGMAVMQPYQPQSAAEPEVPELAALYAGPAERVETHVLGRGETLGAVLARARITGSEVSNLLLAIREYQNPRRMRAGSEITVRRWAVDDEPSTVELRLNPDSLVRLDRRALGWDGTVEVTPVTVDTVYVAGTIERGRTLYQSLVGDDALDLPRSERIQLVADLAEIYGYQLDFSREIKAGDEYRFAYEREARPDGTARSRRIIVAEVLNGGNLFPAIFFDPGDESIGYYDPDGKSLRLAFRRYPIDYVRVTSAFSWRRYHPVLGVHRAHLGTDFGAPHGTPVRATGNGTVASAGWNGGYGNLIVLRHPGGYVTRYAHLSRFAPGLRPGRRVEEGQVIGYVGATGLATGPHLHYEFWRDGQAIDPRTARLPAASPVPEELMPEFRREMELRLALLDRVAGAEYAGTSDDAAATDL